MPTDLFLFNCNRYRDELSVYQAPLASDIWHTRYCGNRASVIHPCGDMDIDIMTNSSWRDDCWDALYVAIWTAIILGGGVGFSLWMWVI